MNRKKRTMGEHNSLHFVSIQDSANCCRSFYINSADRFSELLHFFYIKERSKVVVPNQFINSVFAPFALACLNIHSDSKLSTEGM